MSSTVISKGFVALVNRFGDGNTIIDLDDLQEMLYDENSLLRLNNEGTLVYSDIVPYHLNEEFYGLNIGSANNGCVQDFVDECYKHEIYIDENSVEAYSEIWYNGSDSMISDLTAKEYLDILHEIEMRKHDE